MTKKIGFAAFAALIMTAPFLAQAATLSIQLNPGMSGIQVSDLQTFLAADGAIYPSGLVTGFFGPLTEAAVMAYQTQNGIQAVGRVGPITLASINGSATSGTTNGSGSVAVDSPSTEAISASAGTNSATIGWMTNEPVYGGVMYSSSWPFVYATVASVISTSGYSSSQIASLSGLQSNTTYYYVLISTDASGNLSYTVGNTFRTQ